MCGLADFRFDGMDQARWYNTGSVCEDWSTRKPIAISL